MHKRTEPSSNHANYFGEEDLGKVYIKPPEP